MFYCFPSSPFISVCMCVCVLLSLSQALLNRKQRESILIRLITWLITYNLIFIQCCPCPLSHIRNDLCVATATIKHSKCHCAIRKKLKMFYITTKISCVIFSTNAMPLPQKATFQLRAIRSGLEFPRAWEMGTTFLPHSQ